MNIPVHTSYRFNQSKQFRRTGDFVEAACIDADISAAEDEQWKTGGTEPGWGSVVKSDGI